MAITLTVNLQGKIVEDMDGVFTDPNNDTVTINGMDHTEEFTGSTSTPVSKYSAFQKALSSGTGTIDLTSLPDNNGVAAAVNFNGLKVQYAHFENPAANANAITIAKGASNGYELAGSSWTVTLDPGEHITFLGQDTAPDVASNAKTFDLTGTGSQALDVTLVAG